MCMRLWPAVSNRALLPIISYILTNAGLMANVSINGSRVTRLNI